VIFDDRATDDKFIIVIDAELLGGDAANEAGRIMSESGAVEILEKDLAEKK